VTAVPPDKKDQYELAVELFVSMASLPPDDPTREKITNSIIELCLPLATHVARRYQGRGQPFEDLEQVARVGLVQAVQRYDVDKGSDFLSFAVPTVMGEVRKHFRDHGWSVRVPRSLQERHLALNRALTSLSQTLGRAPTVAELAKELDIEPDEVEQGLTAGNSYRTTPLDTASAGDGSGLTLIDTLGQYDEAISRIDNHETLRPALLALPERERTIVVLRFFGHLTQSQIADKVGISQMHVSRILTQTLKQLRTEMGEIF